MDFHITITFAAILAILQIPATFLVGLHRVSTGIFLGDGGDATLLRRMRAHGNFTETVPITLLAMLAADMAGVPDSVLWAGGLALLAGRLIHYPTIAFTNGESLLRAAGMLATFAAMLIFAGSALWFAWI